MDHSPVGDFIDFDALIAIARRQWKVVAISVLIFLLIGIGYLVTAVPRYTATTRLLIDSSNTEVVERLSTIGGVVDDEAAVLSQVEVLKSTSIGMAVVDKLDLTRNAVFQSERSSLLGSIRTAIRSVTDISSWFSDSSPDEEAEEDIVDRRRRAASDALLRGVDVSRVGRTYVLQISYTSTSPDLAAQAVNTLANEYLLDKLNAKYDATRRASNWLVDRMAELRQKALETDLAVQKFRAQHGLIQTGTNSLVSDQKLTELNSALIVAQSDTARARARLQRIEQILSSGDIDAVVGDILDSSVANDLRKKYLEASKLEAEISSRLGSQHARAVLLRGEMEEYRRLMFEEIARIAQSYKSDLDVAEARQRSLDESVREATDVSATASETQVQLRELQRESETYRNLYETFLQRYQEAVQQQSFPVTEARIISAAAVPTGASHPRKALVLAMFLALGAAAGAAAGAFREYRDRFFRTGDQVRNVLGLEFLGNAPTIENLPARIKPEETNGRERSISKMFTISDYVIDNPLSSFAETMRSAKLAIDLGIPDQASKVIGVISTLPNEGKSTISTNLAEMLASQGARTILVDADIRNPGATRALARQAKGGLLEVLLEGRDVKDLLYVNRRTGLAFLPTVIKQRVPHSSELLTSVAMRKLLADLNKNFDYIILDLPPLGPVIDARAMASRIDGFVFVTEWGKTSRRVVQHTLETEPQIARKCLGVVLNKVDQKKLELYRAYGSSEYYYSRYSKYYQEKP